MLPGASQAGPQEFPVQAAFWKLAGLCQLFLLLTILQGKGMHATWEGVLGKGSHKERWETGSKGSSGTFIRALLSVQKE